MKDPADAKTRLADSLSPIQRSVLASRLFAGNLDFLQGCREVGRFDLAVISSSPRSAALARQRGIELIEERGAQGLSAAATQAAAWAKNCGYERMAIVPGDLARPEAKDLLDFLQSEQPLCICPASDGGTNALLLSPPDAIEFCYGPDSSRLHSQQGLLNGLECRVMKHCSLSYDIDRSPDLALHGITVP